MIKSLEIRNFKSRRSLRLECRRVNIFIGKPNTGKSNILEVIGFLSHIYFGNLKDFIRLEKMDDLFYDHELSESILMRVVMERSDFIISTYYTNGEFHIRLDNEAPLLKYDYGGGIKYKAPKDLRKLFSIFKFYGFRPKSEFPSKEVDYLIPPDGPNLLSILTVNKLLKKLVSNLLRKYGLRLILKPLEGKIEVAKEYEDILITYPYTLISDTLRRLILYLAAIETNEASVIALEEPEAHAFPYYTKYLAERIALDKRNQYFISTHNPYFLLSITEKTPANELAVYITYYEDHQTKVRRLNTKDLEKVLNRELDIFFSIEELIKRV